MGEIRYTADKPEECRYCYFWKERKKQCSLGEEHCFYILPEEVKEPEPSCGGCPYGRIRPCAGYCIVRVLDGS